MIEPDAIDPAVPPPPGHFCYGCGRPIHPAALACPNCGAPQAVGAAAAPHPQPVVPAGSVVAGRNAFCRACGAPMNAAAPLCPSCGAPQQPAPWPGGGSRNRTGAVLLALFLGGFGFHKFYLGQTVAGILYLLFCWTLIPSIIAFVEAIIYLSMSDAEFSRRYN